MGYPVLRMHCISAIGFRGNASRDAWPVWHCVVPFSLVQFERSRLMLAQARFRLDCRLVGPQDTFISLVKSLESSYYKSTWSGVSRFWWLIIPKKFILHSIAYLLYLVRSFYLWLSLINSDFPIFKTVSVVFSNHGSTISLYMYILCLNVFVH